MARPRKMPGQVPKLCVRLRWDMFGSRKVSFCFRVDVKEETQDFGILFY